MSSDSDAGKHRGKSSPTKSVNLIEQLIAQEIEGVVGSEPLQAEDPSEGESRIALAEEPEHDPAAQLDRHTRDQLREMMQREEFQKVIDSPPLALRYLFHNVKAPDALAGGPLETGQLMEPAAGVLPLFQLKKIPPLRVWHGSKCEFLVASRARPDAEHSVQARPAPKGPLSLERAPGSDLSWLFSYTPDPDDKFPFTVTISRKLERRRISHAFKLTPLPVLPAEQTTFGLEPRAVPELVDFAKPEITEEQIEHTHFQDPEFVFNYRKPSTEANLTLRKVQILGERIVFDSEDDPYGLYTLCNGVQDVEQLEIYAETVVVKSPLRLYQTDVVIHARELRLEGDKAQIKTTPWEKTETPGLSVDGEDGLKAGDITLNVCSFYTDPAPANLKRFDLTGGRGQDGGEGKRGTNGASISEYWKTYRWNDSGINFSKTAPGDWWMIYIEGYCQGLFGIPIKAFSKGTAGGWPTDGQSALPSGKPGEGGNGGVLTADFDLANHVALAGGKAGAASKPRGGYYRGGAAGWPTKSIKYRANYLFAASFSEKGKKETKRGDNAAVCYPDKPYGDIGEVRTGGSRYAWLHPVLMTKLLNHAKDDYLGNRIEKATSRLMGYSALLDGYKADPSWDSLAPTSQLELAQIHDEMQLLLHRIHNNLDYFGNPAGWVPLLSFEVNRTIFDNEIDRAANILYYIYCIKNKATTAEETFEALKSARAQLEKDIGTAITQYNGTVSRISDLTTQAENLQKRTLEVQFKLQAKEEELMNQAGPPAWLTAVRLSLKIGGTICSMIPVYQPAMGMVGSGMSLLSDFDPDKPWDTITGAADITTTFLGSSYDAAAGDLKDKMTDKKKLKEADPKGSLTKKINYLNSARKSAAALSSGLKDIQGFMAKQSAPQPEIDAELEKLKTESEEYQALVKEIESLTQQKRDFAEKLAATMQEASSLSSFIDRSIMAIDAMNLDLAQVQAGLDKRTTAYLDDMERRTYDRLLEYHYYMAKAYEYRILEPYTEPLDFKQLIERLEQLGEVDSWDELSADTFKQTYAVVYKEKLAEIANKIFHDYNRQPREGSFRCEYLLSDNDLRRLNSGETITVDFARYLPNEENLRIVDIRILMVHENDGKGDIETAPVKGEYPPNARVDLTFTHPGISWIKSAGNVYQFLHYHLDGANPLVWHARYTPDSDITSHSTPSAASESLLKSLLEGDALSDMMLYCRPSVWTDLQISRSGYPNNGRDIRITHLKLELIYDFFTGDDTTVYKEIIVTALQRGDQGSTAVSEVDLQPYFLVKKADKNQRQDARGAFLRAYAPDWDGRVRVAAQRKYGDWVFNKWTDVTGHDLPQAKGNAIRLDLKNHEVVCAQYLTSETKGTRAAQAVHALADAQLMLDAKSGKPVQ